MAETPTTSHHRRSLSDFGAVSLGGFFGGGEDHKGGGGGGGASTFEYFGWVYHLGINSIGHEYCHLRFLFIRGKYVEMYKRDPHENPGIVRILLIHELLDIVQQFDW